VLERRTGTTIAIAPLAPEGVLSEIADRLSGAVRHALRRDRRVAVVVPLRGDAYAAARGLLADGPPFDPESLGLERHQVFLTQQEAVFVFECERGREGLRSRIRMSSPVALSSPVA
jgi:hypothetical protein